MSEPNKKSIRQEKALTGVVDRDLVVRLLHFIRPYWVLFVVSLLLLPMASGLSLLQPHLVQLAIDDHIAADKLEGLSVLVFAFIAALFGEYLLRFVQFFIVQLAGQRALRDLRCRMFEHLQSLSIRYFHKTPVGRLMARLTTDVDSLNEALSSGVITIVGDIFTLVAIVTILLFKSWELALVTFAVVPPLMGLSFVFRKLMRAAYRKARVEIARLNAYLQEAITGIDVIQLFAHEAESAREYDEINVSHRNATFRFIRWDAILYALVEMISSVAIACIIWYGAGQTVQDVVTIGVLVAFIEYVQKFFIPIRDLAQKYALIQSAMASAERIFELLDEDDVVPQADNARPLAGVEHEIEFKNVWFAYDADNWVLEDVSFTIGKGEKIAFVGHTGAGKTTIISLLARLYDIQKGEILIDGVDIRQYDLADLRRRFAVVLQDVFLFAGSIRDNITLRTDHVTDDDIHHATEIVGLGHLLSRFENGLDHEVRERGNNLSAGERQMIAFARALAHRPDVLILDEATANVDTETEGLIQEAIDRLLQQQTSVVIAHRLSTIQRVDKIVVLHHGHVAEIGSHDELMSKDGLYSRLVRYQYGALSRAA